VALARVLKVWIPTSPRCATTPVRVIGGALGCTVLGRAESAAVSPGASSNAGT
jgi:hypothetical protein